MYRIITNKKRYMDMSYTAWLHTRKGTCKFPCSCDYIHENFHVTYEYVQEKVHEMSMYRVTTTSKVHGNFHVLVLLYIHGNFHVTCEHVQEKTWKFPCTLWLQTKKGWLKFDSFGVTSKITTELERPPGQSARLVHKIAYMKRSKWTWAEPVVWLAVSKQVFMSGRHYFVKVPASKFY